jgi:hypothetical protein
MYANNLADLSSSPSSSSSSYKYIYIDVLWS